MTEETDTNKIFERITQENRKSLKISRVPGDTKQRFLALADAEFESDYGMTLKWLMDGIISAETIEILDMIHELRTRIERLETTPKESSRIGTKQIKMLDGSIRKVNSNEQSN